MSDEHRLELLVTLHFRVLEGDEPAREEIACLLVPVGAERIRGFAPDADPALVCESVHDAILDYLRAPQSFDPSRARLDTFIGLAAKRNLIDRLRRLRRISDRELAGGHPLRSDIAHVLPDAGSDRSRGSILAAVTRSAAERAFLESRLAGERRTAILARILGPADATVPEQRRTVKRMADRLRLRLKRLDDAV